MEFVHLDTDVKKWGNSYAVRITARDLKRLGIREGQTVHVAIEPARTKRVDLSGLPTFRGGGAFAEARDDYYARHPLDP